MTTPEIARLNPFDGLFLRAVHLQQIQLYTQALARALGAAGDPGVVYGYGVALAAAAGESAGQLQVQPGLAVDADGRILLSEATIEVDLPGPGETLVWRIDLTGIDEPYGQENSYGDICVDPCEPAVGTTPFVREVAGVVLTPVPVPRPGPGCVRLPEPRGLVVLRAGTARGRPAHRGVRPGPPGRAGPAHRRRQLGGTDRSRGRPVGVGLLLRTAGGFVLDVWAARRDRVQTPPETGWMGLAGDAAVAGVHRPAPAVPGSARHGLARSRAGRTGHTDRPIRPCRRVEPADRGAAADRDAQAARAGPPC